MYYHKISYYKKKKKRKKSGKNSFNTSVGKDKIPSFKK